MGGRELTPAASLSLPRAPAGSPLRQVVRRLVMAPACMAATAGIVHADRGGYHDNADRTVSFLDSVYYATVTLSSPTGAGSISSSGR
jgi:voltage-gated potassium channel